MLALTIKALASKLTTMIFLHFPKRRADKMLKKHQQQYAPNKYPFRVDRLKRGPIKLPTGETERRN
jgi:hypothetical protein